MLSTLGDVEPLLGKVLCSCYTILADCDDGIRGSQSAHRAVFACATSLWGPVECVNAPNEAA